MKTICPSCCGLFWSHLCVSSIQQVIEQNSGNEQVCDERDGWCALGTTDKLRDVISAMIKKVIRVQKPGKKKYYQKTWLNFGLASSQDVCGLDSLNI